MAVSAPSDRRLVTLFLGCLCSIRLWGRYFSSLLSLLYRTVGSLLFFSAFVLSSDCTFFYQTVQSILRFSPFSDLLISINLELPKRYMSSPAEEIISSLPISFVFISCFLLVSILLACHASLLSRSAFSVCFLHFSLFSTLLALRADCLISTDQLRLSPLNFSLLAG